MPNRAFRIMRKLSLITAVVTSGLFVGAFLLSGSLRAEEDSMAALQGAPSASPTHSVRWRNPGLEGWEPEFSAEAYRGPTRVPNGWTHLARPTSFRVPVFDTPEKPRSTIARMRRGDVVPARKATTERTCYDLGKKGDWWEIPGGFICSTSGYQIAESFAPFKRPQRRPAVHRPLPFRYGHVKVKGAPRFRRRPTAAELAAIPSNAPRDAAVPGVVIERMWDDFFLALDRTVEVEGEELFVTVFGEYVRVSDVKVLEPPNMQGEKLGGDMKLPLAFVYGPDRVPLYCEEGPELRECGTADKHARFRPQERVEWGGEVFVRGPQGALISRDRIRVVKKVSLAPGVTESDRWVHVDLKNQALVAYEGRTPVYATLISSGKETHKTPTGLYQVRRKFLTKIKRGEDPKEGIYHVEEVPWTTYYYGAYALHGAYWHNTFGQVRSHGCTNIAPADARWLYYWGEPSLRPQFHAQVNEKAMHVHFTDG